MNMLVDVLKLNWFEPKKMMQGVDVKLWHICRSRIGSFSIWFSNYAV